MQMSGSQTVQRHRLDQSRDIMSGRLDFCVLDFGAVEKFRQESDLSVLV